MHRGDGRLRQLGEPRKGALEVGEELAERLAVGQGAELGDICARGEGLAFTGHDHRPDAAVVVELGDCCGEGVGERGVEGVELVGAVEDQLGDGAVALEADEVGRHDRGTSVHGSSLSTLTSPGRPSTRSPRMLRMTSDVPPSIDVARLRRKAFWGLS